MLFVFAAVAAVSSNSAVLEPASPWEVSASSDGCLALRKFKSDDKIYIGFEATFSNGPPVLLIHAPNALLPSGIAETDISFDEAAPVSIHYGAFAMQNGRYRMLKLFPDKTVMASLRKATQIRLRAPMPPLRVSAIASALNAFDQCMSDQLTAWGVSPTPYLEGRLAKTGKAMIMAFDPKNYPPAARRAHISGKVLLLVQTDPTGAVTDCKAVVSPDEGLGSGSCNIAKNQHMIPASDATGQPIASYGFVPIRWSLP